MNLFSNSGATSLSILIIGVTLSLPLGLRVIQENLSGLVSELGSEVVASVYLDPGLKKDEVNGFVKSLESDARFQRVKLINRDEALISFGSNYQLGQLANALGGNPLPDVIEVALDGDGLTGENGRHLKADLLSMPGVVDITIDMVWVDRVKVVVALIKRATIIFSVVLGLGVLLVTGNTIRLGIYHRQDEIEVAKLFGATNAYIRRPFLYSGALQGALGALVALIINALALMALSPVVANLIAVYESAFAPPAVSWSSALGLLLGGASLGWFGALVAVNLYLAQLEGERS